MAVICVHSGMPDARVLPLHSWRARVEQKQLEYHIRISINVTCN
jgi:hypothetical protein